MADLEKVIKGLEDSFANQGCGYMDGVGELYAVSGENLQNAIVLLKEQEPVKPRYTPKSIYSWECGVCTEPFDRIANYCPNCGRAVKWE